MGLWKYRANEHITEDASLRIFLNALPARWIWRIMTPDYGIDLEIELAEPFLTEDNSGKIIPDNAEELAVSGTIIWIQLKGTKNVKVKNGCVKYDIETSLLRYVLGCSIPVILVLVDIHTKQIYWFHLQSYLRSSSRKDDFRFWTNKTSVQIDIDTSSCILNPSSQSFELWVNIAEEIGIIKELAEAQSFLYHSRQILTKLATCHTLEREALFVSLQDQLSSCFCLGLLFHSPRFPEGLVIKNTIIDPLCDLLDKELENKTYQIDIAHTSHLLEELSGFASEVTTRFIN